MAQIYKVFFNDRTLFVLESETDANLFSLDAKCINPNSKEAKEFIENFRQNKVLKSAAIITDSSSTEIIQWIKDFYKFICAAGGLVENNESEYLFIHRLGCWDLPKGKVEKDEHIATAAVREVEEECSIEEHTIQYKICSTFHTYELKGQLIFKETVWYKMHYEGNEVPQPQTEENIALAIWRNKADIEDILSNTYPSIIEVIKTCKLLESKN